MPPHLARANRTAVKLLTGILKESFIAQRRIQQRPAAKQNVSQARP
jgi:hypothetical protein